MESQEAAAVALAIDDSLGSIDDSNKHLQYTDRERWIVDVVMRVIRSMDAGESSSGGRE